MYWLPVMHSECDNCVHLLVDDVEILEYNVSSMKLELESVSVGVLAVRRLEKINSTVAELRPPVNNLLNAVTNPAQLIPIKELVKEAQNQADDVSSKVS